MQDQKIRLHHYEPSSQVNGPGMRAVIWVQGCALGCPGCFNPETHDFFAGEVVSVSSLLDQIQKEKDGIEGITISGGEPVHQQRPLAHLFKEIRRQTNLSILVFSGYELEEMNRMPGIQPFLAGIDVLISGRYNENLRIANGLIGSANKTVHFFTNRYTMQDLAQIPQAEVTISPQGDIKISGIDPLQWK